MQTRYFLLLINIHGFEDEQNKTHFFLKDDSLVRSQAIQDSGREAARSPHPGGQTNGSRNTHKSGENLCVGMCVRAGGRVQLRMSQQNSKLILWEIKAKRKKKTTLKTIGASPDNQETWISKDSLLFKGASTTKSFSHGQEPESLSGRILIYRLPKGPLTSVSESLAEGGGGPGTLLQVPGIRVTVNRKQTSPHDAPDTHIL